MKIELYVVTTVLTKVNIAELEQLKVELCAEFGGLTEIVNCKGYWQDNGKLESDVVNIWKIYSLTTDTYYEQLIKRYAFKIKTITNQKIELLVIDDKPYFI